MWKIAEGAVLVYLACCTREDIRKKEISVRLLGAGTLGICLAVLLWNREGIEDSLAGAAAGAFFFLAGKVTRQAIGYGDCWMITLLGLFLGVWKLLVLLLTAFILAALAGGIGMVWKKWDGKKRLPFFPFLLAGYLGVMCW